MDILTWYLLFAVTTSLASMYELFIPVLSELEHLYPENNIVQYKWLSYFTFFMLTLLLAPLVLPSCLVPSVGEKFKAALLQSLS